MAEQMWDTATAPPVAKAPTARVLVVDDEPSMRQMLSFALRREGYDVSTADDGRTALEAMRDGRFDLVVTDVRMPEVSGVDLLREAKRLDPSISIIMMTAYGSKETVLEALRLGATDYVEKTPNLRDELTLRVRKELDRKRLQQENVLMKRTLKTTHQFSNIIGTSEPMLAIFQLVETIAPTSSTVLIQGESGTGKELVARAIHFNSARKDRPFVALNCGALSETLLDSELFGHVRGAFTSADSNKKGLIEIAEKGTIFLDEIGEMSPLVQVKLLRVLEERKFERLGNPRSIGVDTRVIAATHRNLEQRIAEGGFREDLYYRLNVFPIHVPALRDRPEDIPRLVSRFVEEFSRSLGKRIEVIDRESLTALQGYSWPGNIRELRNVVERAMIVTTSRRLTIVLPESPSSVSAKHSPKLIDIEKDHILAVLESAAWRIRGAGGAANRLGMKPTTLETRMAKLGLRRPRSATS
jgi:DNA-binding NtrC family response regulator